MEKGLKDTASFISVKWWVRINSVQTLPICKYLCLPFLLLLVVACMCLYIIYIHRERIINIGKTLKCHHPVTTILLNHVTQCCDIYPFLWCIIFNVCIYVRVFVYTESCAIFFKVSGRTFVYQWVSDKNPLLTPCFFFQKSRVICTQVCHSE